MLALRERLERLDQACQELLSRHPRGIGEYAMIQALRAEPYTLLPRLALDDHLGLFQSHFLLFHRLYRLRERLWRERTGHLEISPLLIRLLPYRQGEAALCTPDPLRDYYLDLSQLEATGEGEVAELLAGFWRRQPAAEGLGAALALLGLEEPVTLAQIRRGYRRQVMAHHPDRGGDTGRMQALNEALALLQRHYR